MKTFPESVISCMPVGGVPEETSLRVEHLGETWIVENCLGASVGDAEDREEAIKLARTISQAQEVSSICVHSLDGSVECTYCT